MEGSVDKAEMLCWLRKACHVNGRPQWRSPFALVYSISSEVKFLMSWSTKRNFSSSSVVSTPTSPSPVELVIYFYVLCGTLDFIGKGGSGVDWSGEDCDWDDKKGSCFLRSVWLKNSKKTLNESTFLAVEGFFPVSAFDIILS